MSSPGIAPRDASGLVPLADVQVRWDVGLRTRDGIRLSAIHYSPGGDAAAGPVIVTLTPYVAQRYHDLGLYFAQRGFHFLSVDVRGRGNSEGVFRPPQAEAADACDVIGWIAKQDFCDGKVAMWGGSYSGYLQWAAAKERPPGLVSIAPMASPFRGVDSPAPNNIFLPYRIQWLTLISGRTSQDLVFADQPFWNQQFLRWARSGRSFREIDSFLGLPSEIFQEWLEHPAQDAYWDAYNPTAAEYGAIELPILTITGAYDVNQRGALEHYRRHLANASGEARSRHFLIMGPWDHAGMRAPRNFGGLKLGDAAFVDLLDLYRQWVDWTMERGPKPSFLKSNVAYYVTGEEAWRYASSLEAVTGAVRILHIQASATSDGTLKGSLADAPVVSGSDEFLHDPRDLSLAGLEAEIGPDDLVDGRLMAARGGRQLTYETAPLEEELLLAGFFAADLWIAIDQPDADFQLSVYEVGPGGELLLLARDSLRARYREGSRDERLVETREPLRYEFRSFNFAARRLKRGSRLRLAVDCGSTIFKERNGSTGDCVADGTAAEARPVRVRIHYGPEHPSVLHVPVGCP